MGILSNLFKTYEPVVLECDNRTIVVHNKKEAQFYAAGFLKIANDCANLVNSTKNVDVFFSRYDLLIEKMQHLATIEKFGCFSGQLPSKNLNNILSKKDATINNFIDRYYNSIYEKISSLKTENAKIKKIDDFYNTLSKYNSKMNKENIEKYLNLYNKLKMTCVSYSDKE